MTVNQPFFAAQRGRAALLWCIALCATLLIQGDVQANASASAPWIPIQIAAAPDGTTRVLWTADISGGEVVSLWKLDSAGNFLAASAAFGPYVDSNGQYWRVDTSHLIVAPSGATSLLWTKRDAKTGVAVSIWTLDSNLARANTGPTYGPYTDSSGAWAPYQFLEAGNGSTRLLWTKGVSGPTIASVWTFDSTGTATSMGPAYGPFSDSNGKWAVHQIAAAPDGTSRLLWENANETTSKTEISFWTLTATGVESNYGPVYGPFADWDPVNFEINPTDSTLRVLWSNEANTSVAGDAISAWSLTTTGTATAMGQAYGPYSGWYTEGIWANRDGTSRAIWQQYSDKDQGLQSQISVWTLNGVGQQIKTAPAYGPFASWSLADLDIDPVSGSFRLLWQRDDNAASTWSLDYTGTATAMGPAHGPFMYNSP